MGGLEVSLRLVNPVPFSFEGVLERGRIHLGVGPNGAGKTSFLRALAGLLPAYPGSRVAVDGQNLLALPPRERARWVGLLPQMEEPGMDLSVEEMVLLGRFPHFQGAVPGPEDRVRTRKVLEDLELLSLAKRPVSTLSGGERQWVRVARLVAQNPHVALFDEPDQHLDDGRRQALMDLMRRWRNEGKVVFWVSHNPCGLERFADCLWRFAGGRLVREKTPGV